MAYFELETEHLRITEFDLSMAEAVHINSLDADTRRFVPDEVFETVEAAREVLTFLIESYRGHEGPFVYPVLLKDFSNIGYVQAAPLSKGWELGYHIAKQYTGKGYATEAVQAFFPAIMKKLGISQLWGICVSDNIASCRVLEKCSFKLHEKRLGEYKGQTMEIREYLREILS